jgi:hypothetical protein
MQPKNLHVLTKLGRACELLKAAEVMPEMQKCTGTIRRARLEIEDVLSVMKTKRAVNWRNVSEILGVISKAYALLKLLGLGEIINFCNRRRIRYAVT